MKQNIGIYLAGSIQKGHEKSDDSYWTDADQKVIRDYLQEFQVSFLNPAFRTDDLSHMFSVFGRDMLQVFSSHFVFVDARERRGLGVGAEMMWAKVNRIPVITWSPKNSHYNKENTSLLGVEVEQFVHPFVLALSDAIVENLEEGAEWISAIASNPDFEVKGIETMSEAMYKYREEQLHFDEPMQELMKESKDLQVRMVRPVVV